MNWLFSPSTYRQRQRRRTLARIGAASALIAGAGVALVAANHLSTPAETAPAANSGRITELSPEPTVAGDDSTLTRDLALAPGIVTEVAVTAADPSTAADGAPGGTSDWLALGAFGPAEEGAGRAGWSDFELSVMAPGLESIGVGSDVRRDGPPTPGGQDSVAVFMGLAGGVIWPDSLFEGMAIDGSAPGEVAPAEATAPDK